MMSDKVTRFRTVSTRDRWEYIVINFKTRVDHEIVIPKGEDIDKTIRDYLDYYESIYPETKLVNRD